MSLGAFLQQKYQEAVFSKVPYSPDSLYVGLFAIVPSAVGSGTELPIGVDGYIRAGHDVWLVSSFGGEGPAAHGLVQNSGTIVFSFSGNVASVLGFGLFDQSSGGNRLWQGVFPEAIVSNSGEQITFHNRDLEFDIRSC